MLVEDDAGAALELVYFNADPTYLKRLLPEGSRRLDLGQARSPMTAGCKCPIPIMWRPLDGGEAARRCPLHEPVYPLTAGLTNTTLRKAIGEALAQLPALPEWIDGGFLAQNGWPSFAEALARLHAPESRGRSPAVGAGSRRGSLMTSFSPISLRLP